VGTFVVGDVHGCVDELEALLRLAGVGPRDALVFVGDLVAKGPDSQAVVQLARERRARSVLGNHDAHLLAGHAGEKVLKGSHAAVARSLTARDWAWLAALPLWLEVNGALVVHGGLLPGVRPARQPRHVLLNLRSITPDGKPSTRVDGGVPWASLYRGRRRVVFGHDALRGLQRWPRALGLDTGCVYGKALTGVWLGEDRLVSVEAEREYCPPIAPGEA
jgi:diadenosine tetraphosphatase ApaH/serine/threonine PP2A family protein phosphatase